MNDELLFAAIDELVPRFDLQRGDWGALLKDAGLTKHSPHRRSSRYGVTGRRLLLATVVLLAALLATPAFGLRELLLDLVGRTNVPFLTSKPAPNVVKKQWADLAARTASFRIGGPSPLAAEARDVGTFTVNGHARALVVAPTRQGGYCYEFEKLGGSCSTTGRDKTPLAVSYIASTFVSLVDGAINAPTAARLEVVYADKAQATIPFVWVSQPIAAGFFAYDVPASRRTPTRRPVALVLTAASGKLLARDTIRYTAAIADFEQTYPPLPHPARRVIRPRGVPNSPTSPLQHGVADGASVVVGANGVAVFTTSSVTATRFQGLGANIGYSCFRLTREFGIPGTSGDNVSGGLASRFEAFVGSRGPFDGCEIGSSAGHTWPPRFHGHAAVEIPLTPAGKRFFTDRAAARDLAFFVETARLRRIWTPGGSRLAGALQRTFGNALTRLTSAAAPIAPGRIGYTVTATGASFIEKSPTGKRFEVTIAHHWIAHQNLRPYTEAYLFWKRTP